MPDRVRIDGPVDVGIVSDNKGRVVLSPVPVTHITPFVPLVVDTDIMGSGDALGGKSAFTNIPTSGVIHSIVVRDAAKQSVNLDVVFFTKDILGTANNAAFDPKDEELLDSPGSVLVDVWKAFNDNSQGTVDNIGLPYSAPEGILYFQCVTRGTPTYVAADDIWIALGIVL